jgi:hypothetical protein
VLPSASESPHRLHPSVTTPAPTLAGAVCPAGDRSLKTEQRKGSCQCGQGSRLRPAVLSMHEALNGQRTTPLSVRCQSGRFRPTRLFNRSSCPSGERDLDGEFDPGSGRTLAACLKHASRTRSIHSFGSGEDRVANGCVTREEPAPETGITLRKEG